MRTRNAQSIPARRTDADCFRKPTPGSAVSNYGDIRDTDPFRGRKHKGGPTTERQGNSCTLYNPAATAAAGEVADTLRNVNGAQHGRVSRKNSRVVLDDGFHSDNGSRQGRDAQEGEHLPGGRRPPVLDLGRDRRQLWAVVAPVTAGTGSREKKRRKTDEYAMSRPSQRSPGSQWDQRA